MIVLRNMISKGLSATKSGKNCPNAPQGREKTEKKPCPLSRLSSTFRMAATLFHSALLMPPLNEPTNLEKLINNISLLTSPSLTFHPPVEYYIQIVQGRLPAKQVFSRSKLASRSRGDLCFTTHNAAAVPAASPIAIQVLEIRIADSA